MKICLKCNSKFKTLQFVDGKTRNLGTRKFCLECSPFGSHNTSPNLNSNTNSNKTCSHCKLSFPATTEHFYVRSRKQKDLSSYCKKCNTKIRVNEMRKTKQKCVDYMGKKCADCKDEYPPSVFDFHHLDPSKKDFTISKTQSFSFKNLKPELDKCVMLCANCHRIRHN